MVLSTFLRRTKPAVEQRQAGTGHHQNQRGADQHPGVIAGALRGFGGFIQIGEALVDVGGHVGRDESQR